MEVASSYGGFKKASGKRYFREDPTDPSSLICLECSEDIAEAITEMNMDDYEKEKENNA